MAAKLFTVPSPVAFNSRGLAVPGAVASFYTTGTTTAVNVYSDSGLSVSLGSSITSDAIGRFPVAYRDEATPVRLIITDATGAQLADVDPFYFGAANIAGSVTLSALAPIATDKVLGRATAGTGVVELIDCTAAGRALIDDASASAQLTTLGVSTFAKTILDDADAATMRATIGAGTGGGDLVAANNLSDVGSASTSRTNLSVPSISDLAAAIASVTGGNSGGILPDGFVSGGNAIWTSGLAFKITAAQYRIGGTLYTSTEQTVTLAAADATNPRIDVLYLDTGGLADKITGTASANPSEPDVDPATQLEVTFVTVAALATIPTGATNESVYLEDTEWTTAVTGAHITKNSTNNPRTGTKDVEATSAVTGDSILFNKGSTVSASSYTALVFYIRNKTASWGTTRLRLHFQNASGVRVGNIVSVLNGTFGFLTANTSSYQAVSIPLTAFAIPASGSIQKLNIAVTGATAVGWYIDDVVLQLNGAGSGSGSGLTQTQADARYAQRSANLSDLGSASTARTNLGVGTGDSPQFTAVNIGAATDTTVTRTGAGDIAVEGNALYRAGGTDVPVADGGTGSSTALGARTNLGLGTIATFDETTSAQFQANTSGKALSTDKVWSAADTVSLTDAATVALDLSTGINFSVTLGGNRTLGNPSNTKNGQSGAIFITQDGTGTRTLAYSSNWKFAGGTAPVLTTTAAAVDMLFYQVKGSTFIFGTLTKDVK